MRFLPATDNPLNVYEEYLMELENVVYALQKSGPVVIIGDFNAHIGLPDSNRAQSHQARRAFFALGSIGAFHGRLNPLTGRSLFEPLSYQHCSMDVRHGSFLNLTSTSLNHFKLRLENVFWVSQSTTPTSALALVSTGPLSKLGSCAES